jgi:hypothetical protein
MLEALHYLVVESSVLEAMNHNHAVDSSSASGFAANFYDFLVRVKYLLWQR